MGRPAGRALPGRGGFLEPEDPLHLPQLGVGLLKDRRVANDDLHADSIASRHLIDQAPEVELKLGDPRVELISAPMQIDD
jgi:hypothetical protein